MVDRFACGDEEASLPGLPERGAGKEGIGLGRFVRVEWVIGAGGLVEEAEEEGVAADRRVGAEEGRDGLDCTEFGRLQ